MHNSRLACVRIRRFALEWWLAQNPRRRGDAVALAETARPDAVIRQCNDPATRAGVRPGMTIAQGHSLCAGLQVVVSADIPEQEEARKLLALLQRLGPQVEAADPGCYFLATTGLTRLYGSERALATRIVALLSAGGLPVTVGVAGTAIAARIAAVISTPGTFTIIPPGRDQRFMGGLSVTLLEPSAPVAEQFEALGLTTIAQLAALPAGEVTRRFGPEGARLHALATGRGYVPPAFASLPSSPTRTFHFSFSCARQSTLVAYARRLADLLFARLAREDRAAATLRVAMQFEDGSDMTLALGVSHPAVSAAPFLRQFRERLKALRFRGGVVRLAVTLEGITRAPVHQLEWSHTGSRRTTHQPGDKPGESAAPVPMTVPRLIPAHLPEESFVLDQDDNRKTSQRQGAESAPAFASGSLAGMRLLAPPQYTVVAAERGCPLTFSFGSRVRSVAGRKGPWELSGRWWAEDFDRRYFEIQTHEGERYLLYCDRPAARWYLQGVFD